jgi:AraC-like DNA-binding protein
MAREALFRPSGMAAMCSISLRHLERHFAKHFHKTPGAWTRDLRLRLAKKLISQGWSDKAVVAELGFTDSAHLCREFRMRCGTTPQDHAPIHLPGKNAICERQVAFLQ